MIIQYLFFNPIPITQYPKPITQSIKEKARMTMGLWEKKNG